MKRHSFPRFLRLLSYTAVWVGATVASLQLLFGAAASQPPVIAATVVVAVVALIAAAVLEGRHHG